ncbi:App1 family protein [Pedobacter gandavensis]|uniref:App1 family protein n=1 Tax=Pedobacter gandavensis TaxID=2679963 RepID=UPI00292EF0CA|nr:phosphatase domain-containing protein [Pedobacter gandavensis]
MNKSCSVKVYHGYGHTQDLVIYGHVFAFKAKTKQVYSNNLLVNISHLLKLFIVKPAPFTRVQLNFNGQLLEQKTAYDGFFKFEWEALENVTAGWHGLKVKAFAKDGAVLGEALGKVYVPHKTQYAIISDVDDTVMVSHSATIGRRLRELFIKNPRTRKTFPGIAEFYRQLALSHTTADQPNPFFYVSSTEWNLYDYLLETFRFNRLPEGAFLLNQLKRWTSLIKTGKTGHEGKLIRLRRIMAVFPKQKFILFGDNSQKDPTIYARIAEKFPENVAAIFIRNVRQGKEIESRRILTKLEAKGISTCLFKESQEAFTFAQKIGLIEIS